MSRKMKNLQEESLRLSQAMGNRPSVAELRQLEKVLDELTSLRYWPAFKSLAVIHGKIIWAMTGWGQEAASSLPHKDKVEVLNQATLGLLSIRCFVEAGGKHIGQDDLNTVEEYRQEFLKYAQVTSGEHLRQIPPRVKRCGICGEANASEEYTLSDAGLLVCTRCHGNGYGNDPDIMDCPSCGYRFDPGDNRTYFEEYRCAHCGAALEKTEIRL